MSKRQGAVLVDAGYFFKQGMEVLFGAGKGREEACLNESEAVRMLCAKGEALLGRPILRVYWYDAPPSIHEPSASQKRLALCDGLKLRMGTLNGNGQQKGVDALIISDMTSLARNGAVDAMLLVSGDEDLRLAMEEAQSHGVKTMILGVGEEGNASIAGSMAACSDGVRRLSKQDLQTILSLDGRSRQERHGEGAPRAGKAPAKKAQSKGKALANERAARPHPSPLAHPPTPHPAPAAQASPAAAALSESILAPAVADGHAAAPERREERHGEAKRKNRRGARHQKRDQREQERREERSRQEQERKAGAGAPMGQPASLERAAEPAARPVSQPAVSPAPAPAAPAPELAERAPEHQAAAPVKKPARKPAAKKAPAPGAPLLETAMGEAPAKPARKRSSPKKPPSDPQA